MKGLEPERLSDVEKSAISSPRTRFAYLSGLGLLGCVLALVSSTTCCVPQNRTISSSIEASAVDKQDGKIAFIRRDELGKWVWVIDGDGTNARRLAETVTWAGWPSWSPDGKKLAYSTGPEVGVVSAEGGAPLILTNAAGQDNEPCWSPDGSKIVFIGGRDPGWPQIYVMDADGSHQTRLTYFDRQHQHPAWSPDGTRIAFERMSTLGPSGLAGDADELLDIFVMDAEGQNQVNLTGGLPGDNTFGDWSPDGSQIVFTSYYQKQYHVYVVHSDGSQLLRLARGDEPAWSPDGTKIAFDRKTSKYFDIYVMNADGSSQTRLARGAAPSWSPNGKSIVFTRVTEKDSGLFVVDRDGRNSRQLTALPTMSSYWDLAPIWSPR